MARKVNQALREEWRKRLEGQRQLGLTVAEFCWRRASERGPVVFASPWHIVRGKNAVTPWKRQAIRTPPIASASCTHT